MFYTKPPGSYGPGFERLDSTMNWTGPAPKPQPRPQPMMNTGYPVLDLIAGLGQVFNRPMGTPPTFPPENLGTASGGFSLPEFPPDREPFIITENPQPDSRNDSIWYGPAKPKPGPMLRTMEWRDEYAPPRPSVMDTYAYPKPWRDDTEQQDWLKRWDIQPANDARYLPTFPDPNDTSTGAAIRRDWHNNYKDFAKNTIGQYAPMFAEQMPQPQPQQSYGDFMGEIKNIASTLVNSATSQLGGGLGQALSFIPGLGPIMELIGQVANIGSTVAGATGLGGEKAGSILNLVGSIANGAAGGASTAGAEEFGPPMPSGEGGMFSGLRPNQPPSTTPANPPFKPQPAPAASDGEAGWFKPLDQMIAEIEERQARGETFDEKNNVWVKPATATGSASIPQEKRFGQATEDSELNLPKPPYSSWPKDQMPASPFDPNRPPSPAPQSEPEQYGPEMPDSIANTPQKPKFIPFDPEKVLPSAGEQSSMGVRDVASTVAGPILKAVGLGALKDTTKKGIDKAHEKIAGGSYQESIKYIDGMIKANRDANNEIDAQKWQKIKDYRTQMYESTSRGMPIGSMSASMYKAMIAKQMGRIGLPEQSKPKK